MLASTKLEKCLPILSQEVFSIRHGGSVLSNRMGLGSKDCFLCSLTSSHGFHSLFLSMMRFMS